MEVTKEEADKVYVLKKPITIGEKSITVLCFKEPTIAVLNKHKQAINSLTNSIVDSTGLFNMVPDLTGHPKTICEQIKSSDFLPIIEVISSFLLENQ